MRPTLHTGEMTVSSTNVARKLDSYMWKTELDPYLSPCRTELQMHQRSQD